jgi:site-specific DNA recombinase
MDLFERHDVALVAVTQPFNTTSSIGRLMLHVLLSFAQFEREVIGERTRDKMGLARRKGKWLGGSPVLGYDVDRTSPRLVVNQQEAERVRDIFELYAKHNSLLETVKELNQQGWRGKQWTTRAGRCRGGQPFSKSTLRFLLTNVSYLGQVKHEGQVYPGEHEAIVSEKLFNQVGRLLTRPSGKRQPHGTGTVRGLLHGKLYCTACQSRMMHTYTSRGSKRYRYYVCLRAQKNGYDRCRTRSVPAEEIEQYVVDELRVHLADSLPTGNHRWNPR